MQTTRYAIEPLRLPVLDAIRIATPCPADWETMNSVPGQRRERVRHCEQCSLNVYDLSAMSRREAEDLVQAAEGRLCVRLYRRQDGTVITRDCSTLRRIIDTSANGARRLAWLAACGVAAVLGAAAWAGAVLRDGSNQPAPHRSGVIERGMDMMAQARPLEAIISRAWPRQQTVTLGAMAPVRQGELVMGRTAAPRQLPQPKAPERLLMLPEERGLPL